jgi:uncharacterized protein (DUF58 family)
MNEIAATLAFSAIQNNDKIGVIFFSDRIEKFIPPKKGKKHILFIIRELIDFKPVGNGTNLEIPLKYLTNVIKKRCTAFILSDFIAANIYQEAAVVANRKHELIKVRIYDKRDKDMPNVGLIKLKDAETQQRIWIDTSSKRVRMQYKNFWDEKSLETQKIMLKAGVKQLDIEVDQDYVQLLLNFFRSKKY